MLTTEGPSFWTKSEKEAGTAGLRPVSWVKGRASPAAAGPVRWSGEARSRPQKRKVTATAVNAVHQNFPFPQFIPVFENMFVPPLLLGWGASIDRAVSFICFKDKERTLKGDEIRIRIF
jgi:hypothetical protein